MKRRRPEQEREQPIPRRGVRLGWASRVWPCLIWACLIWACLVWTWPLWAGAAASTPAQESAVQESAGGTATPVPLAASATDLSAETFQDELDRNLHASADGWTTEVLSAAAGAQLKKVVSKLSGLDGIGPEDLEPYLAAGFATELLWPASIEAVYTDGELTVRRAPLGAGSPGGVALEGAEGLYTALRGLADGLGILGGSAYEALQKKVKPIRVELGDDHFVTTFHYEVSARHPAAPDRSAGSIQQNAVWTTRWAYPEDADADPKLLRIALEEYEEAELRRTEDLAAGRADLDADPPSTLFADVTVAAMGGLAAYEEQVLPGLDLWFPRVSRLAGMSFLGHHGLAVADVDGDGLEDLYVTDAAGLPNRLYLQNADGTVRDASAASGADWLDPSVSALLVDLDGDADADLVVATAFRLLLHENDGRGRFTLRDSLLEVVTAPTSLSAADFDEDGDLDLYLCGYNGDRDERAVPGPVPYHDARNGGRNALLENRGGFRFEDVTAEVGLDENNHSYSFAAAWDDVDDDGDVDLYVANDFGRNNLYENDGGRFRDVAAQAGVEDVASGMSAAFGDFDRDGRRDIYVSNMFSSAGNRVAFQRRFASADVPSQTVADIQRMARGNTLFRNVGDGTFDDVTMDVGVHMGLWAWASRFGDLNNDGWLDLVVSNGYVTNRSTNDL